MPPSTPDTRLRDALGPVQDALLTAARAEADQLRDRADQAARETLAQAGAQASEIRAQAQARGAAESDELIAAQRSHAAQQARALVLAAERAEYEALRAEARRAAAGLSEDPGYPDVRRRLVEVLRRLLGDEAQVHDAPGGGVTGSAPGRCADLSFARLADQTVDAVLTEQPESTEATQ